MKARDLLLSEETLFRDEEIFTPAHTPPEINHRDQQLKALALAIKPGMRGLNPQNTLLHGPPGTGKTTTIKHLFSEAKETTGKVVCVYVNCEDSTTRFSVFAKIHEAVIGTSPPDTGKPIDAIKGKIFRKLTADKKTLVVALDELDHLFIEKNADKILIDLLKSHATYGFDRVGVIGIMIDESHLASLDEKTRSVYNPERVYYPPYDAGEVEAILAERVKYGLYPNVISNAVLSDVVEKTLAAGDLRVGIDLLRRAGYLAESDASRKITLKHVAEAFEKGSRNLNLETTVKSLSKDERSLLSFLAESGVEKSGDAHEKHKEKTGTGIKKYNEMLAKLEHLRLIDTNYVAGVKGRSRKITLRYEPKEILAAVKKKK